MVRSNSLMQYANYLFILSVCIDQGDGRWKEREKVAVKHDIETYRELAEKLEDQMEKFYEEYSDDTLRVFHKENIKHKHKGDVIEPDIETDGREHKLAELLYFPVTNKPPQENLEDISGTKAKSLRLIDHLAKVYKTNSNFQKEELAPGWPKFEDILRAIGRKYDWKNDRWIKIKQKINKKINDVNVTQNNSDHEKHNFKYKIVKLNRSKSRRNVVVAVTAIR